MTGLRIHFTVSTKYRQDSVIEENFNFVESEEVSSGYTEKKKKGQKESSLTYPDVFICTSDCHKSRYLYNIIDGLVRFLMFYVMLILYRSELANIYLPTTAKKRCLNVELILGKLHEDLLMN